MQDLSTILTELVICSMKQDAFSYNEKGCPMNVFRIVQKRTNKRKEKSSPYRDAVTVLLFVFLLPYVISSLLGHIGEETDVLGKKAEEDFWIDAQYEIGISTEWGNRKISMQEYLIRKLKMVMDIEEENAVSYEPEALKAQAVLLRTELWGLMLDGEELIVLQDEPVLYYEREASEEYIERLYESAVRETDGIILAYEGQPVKAAFFPVSNGRTRSAAEVWANDSYPYLVSVECSQDILSKKYQSRVSLSKQEYCRLIGNLFQIDGTMQVLWDSPALTYDSADYVTKAQFQGNSCDGETFRKAFDLESASFRIEWQEESVIFHVKGVGHGFGMSQYGANEKAVSGETFDAILKDYFFETELEKIE